MTPLIRFLVENLATGAAIGTLTAAGFIASTTGFAWIAAQPLAAALIGWGFASTFAIGYLATAMTLQD
jgi:hypothetical protein